MSLIFYDSISYQHHCIHLSIIHLLPYIQTETVLVGWQNRKNSPHYFCLSFPRHRLGTCKTFFLKLWNPPKPSTKPSPKLSPSSHSRTSKNSPLHSGILRWKRFPSSSSWGSQSRVRSEMRRQEELNILTVTNSLWTSSLHLKAKPWDTPEYQATQKLHFNPRRKPMNKQPQKPCKTCNKKPRHPNRTECLACIQKKEREKARERARKKKEKATIGKFRKVQKKRFSRQNLIKEADRVFSLYIRERDRGKPCVTCSATWQENFQCWHFLSRRHLNTRWTEKNAHGQCPKCNMWWSGEQYLHAQAVDRMYGEWTAERLQKFSLSTEKVTDEEILEVIRKYYWLLGEMAVNFSSKKYFLK